MHRRRECEEGGKEEAMEEARREGGGVQAALAAAKEAERGRRAALRATRPRPKALKKVMEQGRRDKGRRSPRREAV